MKNKLKFFLGSPLRVPVYYLPDGGTKIGRFLVFYACYAAAAITGFQASCADFGFKINRFNLGRFEARCLFAVIAEWKTNFVGESNHRRNTPNRHLIAVEWLRLDSRKPVNPSCVVCLAAVNGNGK